MKRFLKTAGICLLFLLMVAGLIFLSASFWLINTWGGLTFDEVLYHIYAPMTGAGTGVLTALFLKYLLPVLVLSGIIITLFILFRKKKKVRKPFLILVPCLTAVFFIAGALYLVIKLDIINYIKDQNSSTDFIENHYVKPGITPISFPEEKRNLIYIYLESMETTYADKASGGAFDENVIPELTELSLENENFSGNTGVLNGAIPLSGSTWTMGAIFAHTAGLPLKAGISRNDMNTQEEFFPSLVTLGDILESEGYTNEFLVGSNVNFGGRRLYFEDHGDYDFFDYKSAVKDGLIPEDYYVWWGYEDYKLFGFAKDELARLSQEDEPFNLTILTVDTHFEDGYVCELCGDEFEDQYSNVMACSSKQVDGFISWCKKQDFYEDTTIVLVGDHLTMDSDFCAYISPSYQRKVYTAIINSPAEPEDPDRYRNYSTMDMFPTTLAALGAEIKGDRLGLGTNLYSNEDTLLEQYNKDELNKELKKKSEFLESFNTAEVNDALINRYRNNIQFYYSLQTSVYRDPVLTISYKTSADIGDTDGLEGMFLNLTYGDKEVTDEFEISRKSSLEEALPGFDPSEPVQVTVILKIDGEEYIMEDVTFDDPVIKSSYIDEYLAAINNPDYVIFIAGKDEMSDNLSDSTLSILNGMGITSDLKSGYRNGFIAVITPEGIAYEDMGKGYTLTFEGSYNDIEYSIKSAGYDDEPVASIVINGTEYAANKRGLNFVIVDKETGEVLSVDTFDTYEKFCPRTA